MKREELIKNLIVQFESEFEIKANVNFKMPNGFENAFGLFDATKNTLFINNQKNIPFVRFVFTFYHEFRHLLQYNKPEMFEKEINDSVRYVVHYNGSCFKLMDNHWVECKIEDEQLNFVEIYKNLPYELDANNFAFKRSKKHFNSDQLKELDNIYEKTQPSLKIENKVFQELFKKIDQLTNIDYMKE